MDKKLLIAQCQRSFFFFLPSFIIAVVLCVCVLLLFLLASLFGKLWHYKNSGKQKIKKGGKRSLCPETTSKYEFFSPLYYIKTTRVYCKAPKRFREAKEAEKNEEKEKH